MNAVFPGAFLYQKSGTETLILWEGSWTFRNQPLTPLSLKVPNKRVYIKDICMAETTTRIGESSLVLTGVIVKTFHVFKSPDELHVWRQGSFIMEATPGRVLDIGQSRRQFSTLMQGYYLLSIGHISEHSHRWYFRKLRLQPKGI